MQQGLQRIPGHLVSNLYLRGHTSTVRFDRAVIANALKGLNAAHSSRLISTGWDDWPPSGSVALHSGIGRQWPGCWRGHGLSPLWRARDAHSSLAAHAAHKVVRDPAFLLDSALRHANPETTGTVAQKFFCPRRVNGVHLERVQGADFIACRWHSILKNFGLKAWLHNERIVQAIAGR